MKCDLSIELLSGYLDGELDEKQKAFVEEHLESCPSCMEVLREMAHLDKQIKDVQYEEPSREFIFALNRRIMEKVKKKPRFYLFRYTPIFVPATVALLALIVIINIRQQNKIIGLDDRILYFEAKTSSDLKRDLELPYPEPTTSRTHEAKTGRAFKKEKEHDYVATEAMTEDKLIKPAQADEGVGLGASAVPSQLEIPKNMVVRAIIDSTGTILKVATGNTILPQKDTMLENRLQGQQLSPPIIAGKKTQLYIDLTSGDTTR